MKISKKIPQKIYTLTQAIKPDISKNTSFDEAWDIISEYSGLEGELRTTHKTKKTIFILSKSDKEIETFEWDNKEVFKEAEGDWDWTKILSVVLEYIIKNKIVKKPRKKRLL